MSEDVKDINKKEKQKIKKRTLYSIVLDCFYIVFGAFFIAVGINLFLLPHKMTTGGASGIATVIYYLFNINVGITILLINIPTVPHTIILTNISIQLLIGNNKLIP